MSKRKHRIPNAKCRTCDKEFYVKPYFLKQGWGKYCSSKCQYKGQRTGKFVQCEICGKKIWRTPRHIKRSKSQKFFCNKSHQTLWRNRTFVGSGHGNWKNGQSIEYRSLLLREGVKPICKLCGCKDERMLLVHHLDVNRKNHDIKNLVWLCHNCHHLVHHYNVSV